MASNPHTKCFQVSSYWSYSEDHVNTYAYNKMSIFMISSQIFSTLLLAIIPLMCLLPLADKHWVKTNFFARMYICISFHFCVVASVILDQSFWFWFATNSVIHLSNLSLLVYFLCYHPRWHFCHLKARLLQLSPNGPHQPSSILSFSSNWHTSSELILIFLMTDTCSA